MGQNRASGQVPRQQPALRIGTSFRQIAGSRETSSQTNPHLQVPQQFHSQRQAVEVSAVRNGKPRLSGLGAAILHAKLARNG